MELKIDINPEQVNKAVSEAIINSTIGEKLNEIIAAEIKKLDTTWNNPIERVVQAEILSNLRQIINDKYKDQIKEFVAERLTQDMVTRLYERLWQQLHS